MSHRGRRRFMSCSLAILRGLVVVGMVPLAAAQHPSMPPGMSHEEHWKQMHQQAEMKKRGNLAMGFDQEKVNHHFHLTRVGGIIEVGVKENADESTRKQIRDHL